jgi:hypothetical protein
VPWPCRLGRSGSQQYPEEAPRGEPLTCRLCRQSAYSAKTRSSRLAHPAWTGCAPTPRRLTSPAEQPHEQGLRRNNRAENFASGGATTRTQDATVEISTICSALAQRACRPMRSTFNACSAPDSYCETSEPKLPTALSQRHDVRSVVARNAVTTPGTLLAASLANPLRGGGLRPDELR